MTTARAASHTPLAVPVPVPCKDSEWIARIRDGDHAAFELLVRQYSDRLCAFTFEMTRDVEVTKELVQEVFLWVWTHRLEWDVQVGLTSYLYRAARNRAMSFLRHDVLERRYREEIARAGVNVFDRAEPSRSDDRANAAELSGFIERAIASLPTRCREVFTLNRQHGLGYREIADTLEISQKTVEVHMGRALSAMRRHLADWVE
jgi:RNA polymerase sigma-70 factor (ECF subfamily)